MKNRLFHYLAPLLSLFIFALALWALHSALRQYHYQDILAELRQMPMDRILIGLALTVLSYLIMIGYEYLALRYIRRPLELRKIAFASFMSYALSNNTGQALLSGGSMRFRLYTAWGLSAGEIAQVVAFCHLTFWVGFCAICGIVFLVEPVAVPASVYLPGFIADWTGVKEIPLPPRALHYIGAAFVVIAVIYLLLSAFRKSPVKIWQWEFPVPGIKLAVSQLVIVSVDLIIAASVLYVLIPSSLKMDYSLFVGIYLLSIFVGMVSMVPGGLGVFETILILFLSSYIPTTSLVGSLLVYRGLYYILPLITATIMLGVHESLQRYQHVMRVVAYFGKWDSLVAPHLFAFLAFGAGTMLLFSGAVPGEVERLRWLGTMIPLPVLEGSHFLGSLAGVGLLFVARGLQRRLDAAYIFTALLYIAGIVFSLLKGWEFEEALILGLLLGALLPCRAFFYRKSRLTAHPLAIGWIVAIGLVLAASIWLGIFSHKHVDYSHELWWKFELSADAPRFLRASVGTSALTLFLAFSWLLRPAQPEPAIPPPEELEDAMPIIAQFPHTYANLALLGDKPLLFSDDYNAFLMYGIEGRSWVAMGDPVGPKQELRELVWRFREMCDRHDGIPVFYQV
ncbi:lysylphosphatidylglycerol synthetase family protein, partial [Candidatus Sumerlaeota bacterium]|nr:lysylphosphatidylglycerol synthetase family protein [Candidatus Sumerlaeota bacterium]